MHKIIYIGRYFFLKKWTTKQHTDSCFLSSHRVINALFLSTPFHYLPLLESPPLWGECRKQATRKFPRLARRDEIFSFFQNQNSCRRSGPTPISCCFLLESPRKKKKKGIMVTPPISSSLGNDGERLVSILPFWASFFPNTFWTKLQNHAFYCRPPISTPNPGLDAMLLRASQKNVAHATVPHKREENLEEVSH